MTIDLILGYVFSAFLGAIACYFYVSEKLNGARSVHMHDVYNMQILCLRRENQKSFDYALETFERIVNHDTSKREV